MKLQWVLVLVGILVTVVFYNVHSWEEVIVPDEMAGYWATDSPRYRDCYLEITPVSVVYYTQEDTVDLNFVQSVEREIQEDQFFYTIHYKNQTGDESSVSLFWDPDKEEIRLKNQEEMRWTKVANFS